MCCEALGVLRCDLVFNIGPFVILQTYDMPCHGHIGFTSYSED